MSLSHHDVVELHMPEAFHAAVVPVGPLYVASGVDDGQRVLRQRHGERRLRNARTVAEFRYKQVVAREQTLLQRRRGNDVVLEEEEVDEVHGDQGEHQGVDPTHDEPDGTGRLFPPLPPHFLTDVAVEDEQRTEQGEHPSDDRSRRHPYDKGNITNKGDGELRPLPFHIELSSLLVNHNNRIEFK